METELMGNQLTGWAVEETLWAALDHPLSTAMYEGHCAGNRQSAVRGVVVCYTPTLDVLRRAAAEHKSLIISREHPFYLHGGLYYEYCTGGLEAAMKDDPVVQAKRDLIDANNMIGERKGFVMISHEGFEEWGMEDFAGWLKPLVPEVPIEWIPTGDPFQIPPLHKA
jgi:hypothetical protein